MAVKVHKLAESTSSSETAEERSKVAADIEKELKCPICLGVYSAPKLLHGV